jgi:hypothetical protein
MYFHRYFWIFGYLALDTTKNSELFNFVNKISILYDFLVDRLLGKGRVLAIPPRFRYDLSRMSLAESSELETV